MNLPTYRSHNGKRKKKDHEEAIKMVLKFIYDSEKAINRTTWGDFKPIPLTPSNQTPTTTPIPVPLVARVRVYSPVAFSLVYSFSNGGCPPSFFLLLQNTIDKTNKNKRRK